MTLASVLLTPSPLTGCADKGAPTGQRACSKSKNTDGKLAERKQPSWFPLRLIFPVAWSLMAVLRATSATLIWQASGQSLAVAPLALFLLHLVRNPLLSILILREFPTHVR